MTRIVASVLLAGLLWVAVPFGLPPPSTAASNARCLTLPEEFPNGGAPLDVLEACSALYPRDVELLADLAAAYESAGEAGAAERACERALALDPGYADVRLRLARLLRRRGDTTHARAQAEAALHIQPNRRDAENLLQ